MNPQNRSIIGYRVSQERNVDACILAMRMAFRHFKKIPENFRFIANRYIAYILAAQQFFREFRPFKQMIEKLNRTYKLSYRPTNGFDNIDGANYDLALWVAYYNFLRPHKHSSYKVLNDVEFLRGADNMPGKWQLLILLGQQTIVNMQNGNSSKCS